MARSSKRIHLLDEIRGAAIICMVFYHGFYSLATLFALPAGSALLNFFRPAVPWFAGLFILISGIAAMLTRSNLKRGIKLFFVALGMNIVTYLLKYFGMHVAIRFGILNMLAICMLLAAVLVGPIAKIPPIITIFVAAAGFLFTYPITEGWVGMGSFRFDLPESITSLTFLFPLGIPGPGFSSVDYYPLLPWMFAFLGGMGFGVWAKKGKFPEFMYNQHIRPLAFVGRHSLWVYIFHQPVLYVFFLLVQQIMWMLP